MSSPQIVLDTKVFIAGLRSQYGTAHQLLMLIGKDRFEISLSVQLVLEYEEVAKRLSDELNLSHRAIDDILDYLCSVAQSQKVFYLWRPLLSDPKDDMIVELAVAAQCDFIVTYNQSHFIESAQFEFRVITPREFLQHIGELS